MPHAFSRKQLLELVLIVAIALAVAMIARFELQLVELASRIALSRNLLILGLVNLNLLLIVLLLFLVLRNLFRLLLERQRKIPGAHLRTKLVGAFFALSLIPTFLLFLVASGFISKSIQNWFGSQIETSLQESLEVAQTYYDASGANALYYADRLAERIKDDKLLNQDNLPELTRVIREKQQEYNLGVVEIFSATHEQLVRAANPQLPVADLTEPGSELLRRGLAGERFTRITPAGQADLIRGIVPIFSNWQPGDVVGVVVVNYYVPYSLVSKMKEISASYEEYKSTKILKGRIQKVYLIVLALIALVILFLATWFGFQLARSITGPIQELAEATVRVAGGDLSVSIEPRSVDEVGTLVQSFNQMTADLRQGQHRLQEANRDLQASNLELEQRRRYMEVVLENVTAGVISFDRSGCLTTINHSAAQLLKIDAAAMLGCPLREVLGPEHMPLVREFLAELVASGKDTLRKQLTLTIQDAKVTLQVTATTLRDEQHEFLGTVVVFDDLSTLIKAQRMAAWREVARRIAHEIKNPLTPIQLSAQRLRRRYLDRFGDDDRVFDDCTQMIVTQVEELKNLVNEFSNFARLPASNPVPNNLNSIIGEALVLYEQAHRSIAFRFRPDQQLPWLNLDREQIKRVVINLLENSVAAVAPDGGLIEIETAYDAPLQLVTLTVTDNGCGIANEDKPRLFEPYFSTKKSGTGLGLAIVSTIVADHHGYIRVKDNPPRGTRIIIELPVDGKDLA